MVIAFSAQKSDLEFSRKELPKEIIEVNKKLKESGFQSFLIGGCVRDLIIGREPKDWDLTTDAKPEDIIKIFPHTFYENDFGTVGVVFEESEKPLDIIEVTTFRTESSYSDFRRPDSVSFGKSIFEDLERRDFTINAIALDIPINADIKDIDKGHFIDPHNGIKDIKDNVIKTVGSPLDRFNEDALRIMRAIRLGAELGFTINIDTAMAIRESSVNLKHISSERIRDEFIKIIMSEQPMEALIVSQKLGVLRETLPELEDAIDVEQGGVHKFDVFEHLLRSLQGSVDKNYDLEIRLATLFHDIAKPETRGVGKHKEYSFYNHEIVGAKKTKKILERMKFPRKIIEKVTTLIRWHMFFADTEQITLSAVRRMIANVGEENIWDLMNLRICDRIGTGITKEDPYRLRKYKSMIEEALKDPVSVKMLKVNGEDLMKEFNLKPGPVLGNILNILLEKVLDDPKLNNRETLLTDVAELLKMSGDELQDMAERAKVVKEDTEKEEVGRIRGKYGVR